jgi:urease accessory protein
MMLRYFLFLSLLLIIKPLYAHTFTGMNGFYDGLSHPVLGLDHFLAMVCVGVVSSQIGGRAIWTVPSLFVLFMIVGGAAGLFIEILAITLSDIIEWGIIFSVIFLGLSVAIEKKLPTNIIMIAVAFFGSFHGLAHGIEMPWAVNPLLFALGFSLGTATIHLFGVGIGLALIRNNFLKIILRLLGLGCAIFGFYLII